MPKGSPVVLSSNPIGTIDQKAEPTFLIPEARIKRKYSKLGGETFFGPIERKDSSAWYFTSGSCIVDNPSVSEAFEIHGGIYQKWVQLGGVGFGVPCTDETGSADGIGRYNHFNDNAASIYWTPSAGAFGIYGAIRNKWQSLGRETSYLGYPTSDETDFAEGGRANSFQNGGIYWWPDIGATDLRGVIVQYTGLHCFGETDSDQSSSSDEPYFILSVTTPEIAATTRTQIYNGVDGGTTRPDLLEIYRGHPYGINIGSVLMEYDFGDPDKYKDEVQKSVDAVHAAGTVALGLIPGVGPVIAAIVGPALGKLMPAIGGALNDLFDWATTRSVATSSP